MDENNGLSINNYDKFQLIYTDINGNEHSTYPILSITDHQERTSLQSAVEKLASNGGYYIDNQLSAYKIFSVTVKHLLGD